MDIDDLKKYCVIVNDGSGIFYQPCTSDYTYILTCKHIFYKDNNRGQENIIEFEDGEEIKITYLTKNDDNSWKENFHVFELSKGNNYFPHSNEEIDIAILKITPMIDGYSEIFVDYDIKNETNLKLCGYPDNFSSNTFDLKFNTYKIDDIVTIGNYNTNVQLPTTLTIHNIKGISGGGILKLSTNSISLFGIQSRMASISPTGQTSFVQIKYFNEIIEEHKDKLAPLFQQYIKDFKTFKGDILKLSEAINQNTKTKIDLIIAPKFESCHLCPEDIINNHKEFLLLKGEKESIFLKKDIWIKYIQYLLFLSIAYEKNIDSNLIREFEKNKRFIYSEKEGDFAEVIIDILENTNLSNIDSESQIIYGSRNNFASSTRRRVKKGVLTNIAEGGLFMGKQGIDIFHVENIKKIKEIIDINAFETDCIIENEEGLKEIELLNIEGLVTFLKTKLYEFFED